MKKPTQTDIEKTLIDITEQFLTESKQPHQQGIRLDTLLHQHLNIDSLGRAELFRRIEKQFNIMLPDNLLVRTETLQDIFQYLQSKGPVEKISAPHAVLTASSVSVNPAPAKTLLDVISLYNENAPDKTHIYFQREDGQEETITYGSLFNEAARIASGLHELGLQEEDTVAIMLPTTPDFFYVFLGVLLAGGIPVPIYPPFRAHMLEAYTKTEARILRNAEARLLITFDQAEKLSRLLPAFVPSLKWVKTVKELQNDTPFNERITLQESHPAFIQYTSGSTSDPKGVLLTHFNLLSNIRAFGKTIKINAQDVVVSWLPLYHDFGLIGAWLGSLYHGVPLILLTPFSFLNHPERWLWAIHYHRGTISGAPNFAYDLCVRKIETNRLEGLDLSSWRVAANGAEKIYPRTLEQFADRFAPYGLKRQTLVPVYGLAESTVGLTISPIGRAFRIDRVNRKMFEETQKAIPSTDKDILAFVSCGVPMEGHEIRIVNDKGGPLPERQVGQLEFRGPSNMKGYFNNPAATLAVHHDGWLNSLDLAYLAEGEVFITGRSKDLIIKAGRNMYPAEIEELAGNVPGVRQGCVTVFGVTDKQQGTEQLIVVAETAEKNKGKREALHRAILEAISAALDITPDHLLLVGPHTVPKTSSGKLQRSACKTLYLQNKLGNAPLPPWLQMIKLIGKWTANQGLAGLKITGRVLYTAYVAGWFLTTFPLLYLITLFAPRKTADTLCRFWAKFLLTCSFCPPQVKGADALSASRPLIFASNHASYIDVVVALAVLPPDIFFVGKKELRSNLFLRPFMQKLHFLPIDRLDFAKGMADTEQIKKTLQAGNAILIFPEGTFGYAQGLRPFRLGTFKIAAETNTPICPIALKGTRSILRGNEKLLSPGRISVTISKAIQPTGTEWEDVVHLRQLVREEIARHCGEPSLDYIIANTVASD